MAVYSDYKYSYRIGRHKGNPVFEVLVNGKNWGTTYEWDKNFRFGKKKARMLIACIDYIFMFAHNKTPRVEEAIAVIRDPWFDDCANECPMYLISVGLDFTKSYGRKINSPYLRLDYVPYSPLERPDDIGLGKEKSKAVLALRHQIAEFAGVPCPDIFGEASPTAVRLGSRVQIQFDDGEEESLLVVQPGEEDGFEKISSESPLGKAIIGHEPGEDVYFDTPAGVRMVHIFSVHN